MTREEALKGFAYMGAVPQAHRQDWLRELLDSYDVICASFAPYGVRFG